MSRLKHRIAGVPRWIWIIFALLIVIRLLLPMIGLRAINWALSTKMGAYEGHVIDFDLSIWRGAYQVQNIEIKKRDTNLEPILAAEEMDFSLAWRALVRGQIAGDLRIRKLAVNIIDSNDKKNRQYGTEEKNWQDALNALVPISVESLTLENSAFYFQNKDLLKALPVKLEKIEMSAQDLQTQKRDPADALSPFEMTAVLQEHANLKLDGNFDALAKLPRGDFNFTLVNFHPKTINGILLTYLPLDLTSGELSIYGEVATTKGEMLGYLKVFLKDVDVVAPKQNLQSGKHFLIEVLGAFGNWALKNKDKTTAMMIPFERHNGKMNIDAGTAFWSGVDNKKEKLPKGLENSISLKNIEGKKK